MKNLHELPKFADQLSFLYVEHAAIDQADKAIALHQADGDTAVPVAGLSLLMLGPGTRITHAAIRSLADNNCLLVWCGEFGVRFYCQGLGGARNSRNLIQQARLVSNDLTRLQVVIRMYCRRFAETVDGGLTLQQLRGKEGIRVRQAYADAAKAHGVEWKGRSYDRGKWDYADPVNRCLSAANSCLYGLVHAAILSGGYSPALGFIHTGKQLSFVYDVADLYKVDFTVPIAFRIAAEGGGELERRVRIACRDAFKDGSLMQRILPDISHCLNVSAEPGLADEYAEDEARPAEWWQPATVPADLPIGRVLRLDALVTGLDTETQANGRDDSGTGDAVTAG